MCIIHIFNAKDFIFIYDTATISEYLSWFKESEWNHIFCSFSNGWIVSYLFSLYAMFSHRLIKYWYAWFLLNLWNASILFFLDDHESQLHSDVIGYLYRFNIHAQIIPSNRSYLLHCFDKIISDWIKMEILKLLSKESKKYSKIILLIEIILNWYLCFKSIIDLSYKCISLLSYENAFRFTKPFPSDSKSWDNHLVHKAIENIALFISWARIKLEYLKTFVWFTNVHLTLQF
jgi:hypothetical protein